MDFRQFINKKVILIAACTVLAVAAAVICAVLLLGGAKKAVQTDASESSQTVSSVPAAVSEEAVSSEVDNGIRLVLTSPAKLNTTVTEPHAVLTGTSDPAQPLIMNDAEVVRDPSGYFSMDVTLNNGANTFTFIHKGETTVCTITYRYVVITGYYPSTAQTYASGSTFTVNVQARAGSRVTAAFNGQTIELPRQAAQGEDEAPVAGDTFCDFAGSFTLPAGNMTDLKLGKVKFTGTYNGLTESFSSGNITCKKTDIVVDSNPAATPPGGHYINVGSGYIAEVVAYSAETFDGTTTDDWSRPTNNYLPKGTVDYCSTGLVYDSKSKNSYYKLRCGRRIYVDKISSPSKTRATVATSYVGTLPDHNEIVVAAVNESTRYTTLTFNTLWKAPFYFDLLPQSYKNTATRDYTVSAVTYNYIDITFCYATSFTGDVPISADNPIFSRAELIQNQSDYTLRLYLKKTGAFYGWDANYNENGQLVFEFLHPARVSDAANSYGINLSGVKILIDVGHGGVDIGAPGRDSANHPESDRNLNLANKLKSELESIGATVVMTRYGNSTVTSDERCQTVKREQPDYCIAIHHNSAASATPSGFGSYHFDAFSSEAAKYVYLRTANAGLYGSTSLQWHYFYTARMTNCPVVLTENGFISNAGDFAGIMDEGVNIRKAQALTQGIADYFRSIQ